MVFGIDCDIEPPHTRQFCEFHSLPLLSPASPCKISLLLITIPESLFIDLIKAHTKTLTIVIGSWFNMKKKFVFANVISSERSEKTKEVSFMFSSSCFFCNLVLLSLSLSLSLLFLLYFIQLINDYHASFAYLFQMCVNNQITYIRNFITVSVNSDSINIHCLFFDLDHTFLNWIE